jgi:lysyl-tRNA synthetase class 2
VKEVFVKRTKLFNAMRQFFNDAGYMEVDTPVLQPIPGGASARPFITHHNALNMDVYLRISMGELWQKRLMVAGFDKTFEILREGTYEHKADFTLGENTDT